MWSLPISELFMLGRKTVPKLYNMRIRTIGISQVLTTLSLVWLALFLGFNNDMSLEEVALFLCIAGLTFFFIVQQYQCKFYVDFMDEVRKLWMQSK